MSDFKIQPITGERGDRPLGDLDRAFSWGGGAGAHLKIPFLLSQGGSGGEIGAEAALHPDFDNAYFLRGNWQSETFDGNTLVREMKGWNLGLTVGHRRSGALWTTPKGRLLAQTFSENSFTVGFGENNGHTTIEWGNTLFARSLLFRPGGRFGIRPRFFLNRQTSWPTEPSDGTTLRMVRLNLGLTVDLLQTDLQTLPGTGRLTSWDIAFFVVSSLHRLADSRITEGALGRPVAETQETAGAFFGEGGFPSAREEGSALKSYTLFGASGQENEQMEFLLKADTTAELLLLFGTKAIVTASLIGFGTEEHSALLAPGVAGLATLGLSALGRKLRSGSNHDAGRTFWIIRSLAGLAPFAGGVLMNGESEGTFWLPVGQQLLLSALASPDIARSGFASPQSNTYLYGWDSKQGGLLGFASRSDFTNSPAFAETAFLFQDIFAGSRAQDIVDVTTGRDAGLEAAVARTVGALGLAKTLGPLTLSAAARAVLQEGGGNGSQGGFGLQEGALLTLGRLNVGLDLTQDSIGDQGHFGVTGRAGFSGDLPF